jgi:transposase
MFLRRFQKKEKGSSYTYWALVESYRTQRGARQRVVSYLGELSESELSGWARLARKIEAVGTPKNSEFKQLSFFEPPPAEDATDSIPQALVSLRGVRLERSRDFGDVWLAWGLWRMLGLDQLLETVMVKGREEVPWPVVAAVLSIARFCEPASELHIETTWYRRTTLEDLLLVPPEKIHTDRLYEGLDKLLPHKEAIEKHLKDRLGKLFDLEYEILLYDMTSTYFEGQCRRNPQAKRGYSRDHRPDCLQVCIALIVTTDGMPVGYEVFDGNRSDSTTVEEIVEIIEKKYGKANRIWVLDRGMVSEDNLAFIRDRNGRYIVGTPRASLRKFEEHLIERDWEEVEPGIVVKLVPTPDGSETFILARSAERREKEKAIHERFLLRMETGLKTIQSAIESGRLHDYGVAMQRLGRLQGENSRAAKAFQISVEDLKPKLKSEPDKPPNGAKKRERKTEKKPKESSKKEPTLKLIWSRNEKWDEWAKLSEGCYLLRSNVTDMDAKALWKQYIQLSDAEWAFRISKDELVLRPVWHQKEDRVQAHILVSYLAYTMWKTLSGWMKQSGLGGAPRPLLNEFSKLKSSDVVLPIQMSESEPMRELRIRCVTQPDTAQKLFLNRLGLRLPHRLGSKLSTPNVVKKNDEY